MYPFWTSSTPNLITRAQAAVRYVRVRQGRDSVESRLLNSDEKEDGDATIMYNERIPWYRASLVWLQIIILSVILSLGTAVVVQSIQLSKHHPATVTGAEPGQSGRCGFNATEAMARGCIFDYMNFSWQPPECYDPALDKKHSDMMRKERPVRWWADANLTKPLPDDADVLKMYTEVWTERRYHYKHCMYGWESLHLSYDDGRPLPDLMSHHHSVHCAKVLDRAIREDNGTELLIEHAVTWYSACIWPEL